MCKLLLYIVILVLFSIFIRLITSYIEIHYQEILFSFLVGYCSLADDCFLDGILNIKIPELLNPITDNNTNSSGGNQPTTPGPSNPGGNGGSGGNQPTTPGPSNLGGNGGSGGNQPTPKTFDMGVAVCRNKPGYPVYYIHDKNAVSSEDLRKTFTNKYGTNNNYTPVCDENHMEQYNCAKTYLGANKYEIFTEYRHDPRGGYVRILFVQIPRHIVPMLKSGQLIVTCEGNNGIVTKGRFNTGPFLCFPDPEKREINPIKAFAENRARIRQLGFSVKHNTYIVNSKGQTVKDHNCR
jgi:hypothetical protein